MTMHIQMVEWIVVLMRSCDLGCSKNRSDGKIEQLLNIRLHIHNFWISPLLARLLGQCKWDLSSLELSAQLPIFVSERLDPVKNYRRVQPVRASIAGLAKHSVDKTQKTTGFSDCV